MSSNTFLGNKVFNLTTGSLDQFSIENIPHCIPWMVCRINWSRKPWKSKKILPCRKVLNNYLNKIKGTGMVQVIIRGPLFRELHFTSVLFKLLFIKIDGDIFILSEEKLVLPFIPQRREFCFPVKVSR